MRREVIIEMKGGPLETARRALEIMREILGDEPSIREVAKCLDDLKPYTCALKALDETKDDPSALTVALNVGPLLYMAERREELNTVPADHAIRAIAHAYIYVLQLLNVLDKLSDDEKGTVVDAVEIFIEALVDKMSPILDEIAEKLDNSEIRRIAGALRGAIARSEMHI